MILPILISVSVAPVSYFFCASAPLLEAASTANAAAEAMAILFVMAGISVSLFSNGMGGVSWTACHGRRVMAFLIESSLRPGALSTILPGGSQQKALRAERE